MQGLRFPSAATFTGVVLLLALCSYPATDAQRRRGGGGGGEVVSKEKRDYYEGKEILCLKGIFANTKLSYF
jgi:hypothetical protein